MPNKKKSVLAILVACPLTENICDRIGVQVLSRVFHVIVIDCLDWFSRGHVPLAYDEVNSVLIYRVDSKRSLEKTFGMLLPRFILDAIGKGKLTRSIQEVCKEYQARYITYHLIPSPYPIDKKSLGRKFSFSLVITIIKVILQKIFQNRPLSPDIALLAGSGTCSSWTLSAKKIIFTASPDYFILQKAKKQALIAKASEANLLPRSYILFIDDCLAMSFDYAISKQKPIMDPKKYFYLLDKFFSKLENHFAMPVVIAAHPNGKQYLDYKESFGKRTLLFDATAELSLNCNFVLTHFSSAIAYPVMLRKPIVLLNFKAIKKQRQGLVIAHIADLLDCAVVDIDNFYTSQLAYLDKKNVIESKYKDYEVKFIANANFNSLNSFEPLLTYLESLN